MFYVRGIICSITSTLPQACSNTTKYYCGCGFRCKLWSNRAAKGVQSIAPVIFSTFAMERTPCQQWKIQCKWGKSDPRKVKNPPGATVQKTCGVDANNTTMHFKALLLVACSLWLTGIYLLSYRLFYYLSYTCTGAQVLFSSLSFTRKHTHTFLY